MSSFAASRNSSFACIGPMQRKTLRLGGLKLVARIEVRIASYLSSPKVATSPVDAISTPRTGSAPRSAREREHWRLDADVIEVEERDLRRVDHRARHDARGDLDEIDLERLRDEGEGARGTDVRLDDLDLVVLREELEVERAREVELLRDSAADALDAADGLDVELLRGEHERRIARVDARVLNVLADRIVEDDALARDGVDLDLLGTLDELGDDDRMIGRDVRRAREELHEVRVVEDDLHGRAREDVRRADEARVGDAVAKVLRLLRGGDLHPLGLVDADAVEDPRELVAVLRLVDRLGRRAEDVDRRVVGFVERLLGTWPPTETMTPSAASIS